ncbi:hypothetical protein KJ671_02640 [Patescibacteria group bacterium]|nr:hypothetical protein [Patescibacteria group bacterium]
MDNFKKAILEFNKQLSFKSLTVNNLNKLKNINPDAVIIIGMGGSGFVGDMVSAFQKELNIPAPIIVWKNFGLPRTQYKNPLFIFISFSGNTEETISEFNGVKNKAVICSGGLLFKMAKTQKVPTIIFKNPGIKPRQGSGIMFCGIMAILKATFPKIKINRKGPSELESEKTGKEIAKKIKNKIILLYSSQKNSFLAYIWKTKLNETSKIPAFCGVIPEICHNEIELFENKILSQKILIIFIKDDSDVISIKKKMNKLEKIFKKNNNYFMSIKIKGKSYIERAWNNIILADWATYYLAKLNKVDPSVTKLIDLLKSTK